MNNHIITRMLPFAIAVCVTSWWLLGQMSLIGPRIVFLSVGNGDAIFIENSNGYQVLIDTGPDASVVRQLGSILPVWDRSLDAVFLTHAHADHIGGLSYVTNAYTVSKVYRNDQAYDSPLYKDLIDSLPYTSQVVKNFILGDTLEQGDVTITSLWPPRDFSPKTPVNDTAMVLYVTLRQVNILLTSDVELARSQFAGIVKQAGDIDVLKMPHQGNKVSVTDTVLWSLRAEVIIYSVGHNSYGHPDPGIVALTKSHTPYVFRTDEAGFVSVKPDVRGGYSVLTKYD
ncbi:hypothetical protein CO180_02500 [candidate division WWE3 bacterium CG_4_9_14_3_um_filter_41_6]|uniref:Metallo-beta-lactamase domain-containing protein n=1 Tax=candidate division WWE3 bacterium CG_4_10_14_0_2_um_filter_41_14 TaxID=1975072 RepID=A0A2M7TI16_UNCKA|nr:MAG: hypothetical protein COY32_04315 [candidate division WWE3 bacterium CG_4_10_14_0_2_um_filter_41_14]PJA38783.1 MAG: hypothetical protein CO180_02500 [candidate division WWE3 bacterium CG_4_9_14_3_um_filter_41_6]